MPDILPPEDLRLTISDLAERLGVCTKTILRWEKQGKIRRAPRDWKGWRVYTETDFQVIAVWVREVK